MSPETKPIDFRNQLSMMLLFGVVGSLTEIFVRAALGTNSIFAHTIKDAFYAAGIATVYFHLKETQIQAALISFVLLSTAEVVQATLQSLHFIKGGYSELDFAAYAVGAFALFPLIHYSAKLLPNFNHR